MKKAFFLSYLAGVIFFLFSMYWLIYVSPAGWIILSLYQGLYIALFGVFANRMFSYYKYKVNNLYLIIPSFWVMCEFVRSYLGGGIGWNLLGYSQYKFIPFIQISDITGVYGVSFVIVLINLFFFFLIAEREEIFKRKKSFLKICIIPLIITSVVFLYGSLKIDRLDKETVSKKRDLRVSVVQGNIEQCYKWDDAYKEYIIDKYEKLTLQLKKENSGLIVWPETAVPGYIELERWLFDRVINIVQNMRTYFLIGAPMLTKRVEPLLETYNSALLFSDKAQIVERYDKLHLVPFGEFVPFEGRFPVLRRFLPLTGNFISGKDYTIFELETVKNLQKDYHSESAGQRISTRHKIFSGVYPKRSRMAQDNENGVFQRSELEKDKRLNFSVLICFEDIFSGLVRQFVLRGADFLVNITNDAWFYRSPAAYQHAANSVFRAIENRRPFVRAANTGFSCFIDNIGRIHKWAADNRGRALFVEDIETSIISCSESGNYSFYTRFGDIFSLLCIIIVLAASLFFMIDYQRQYMYNNKTANSKGSL